MGFGRNGLRVAKTPIRVFPPNLGGRTVGLHSFVLCASSLCTLSNPQIIHRWLYPSMPRNASGMLYSGSKTMRVRIGLSSLLCLGIPNLSVCPLWAYAITFNVIKSTYRPCLGDKKRAKLQKITHICKKNAKKFGHIKKKQYFCTRFRSKSSFLPLPAEAIKAEAC